VKLRSTPIDEANNELRFVLEQDGGPLARTMLRLFACYYRTHHALMLIALRHRWGSGMAGGSR
jgi:hypothetical protein